MMTIQNTQIADPIQSLTHAFVGEFPVDAARVLETMPAEEAVQALKGYPEIMVERVISVMAPGIADKLMLAFAPEKAADILTYMDASVSSSMLARFDEKNRERLFAAMPAGTARELRSLLEYPEDTVGRLMHFKVTAFNKDVTVAEAIKQMKVQKLAYIHHLYLLDDEMRLQNQVDIHRIALADEHEKLSALATPIKQVLQPLDPEEEAIAIFEKYRIDVIPVIDMDNRLLGVINKHDAMESLREDLATSMQTMVGVSKDERALSSSFFAVKKRLPWLQINLLTAFLAAAVVGVFENTIAKYTALAILLPIAAGQSGNAGAQALAVTMRGLTLREITMRHWFKMLMKEGAAGVMNGIGVAITCSTGVYFWSGSTGLALVMALSMIISMTIAGMAGAVVPILLKRFGLDPAQSSSIVLTTVTDIAGFMSFLGIATLLSGMLDAG